MIPFAKGGYWNPAGPGIANLNNAGPHGLSEILYAFTSASENNGSAFAGITVNTPWYDLTLGLAMLFGRFLFIIPALAIAGSLASKKFVPTSAGTLPTHGPLFVGLLVATVDRRRRADLLPGAVARPDRRALPDASGASCSLRLRSRSRSGANAMATMTADSTLPSPIAPVACGRDVARPEEAGAGTAAVRSGDSPARAEGFGPETESAHAVKNPVIFVVEIGAALVLLFLIRDIATGAAGIGFELQIDLWLWFTVLFATFAEAMAEARGKAQAESLRKTKTDTIANKIDASGRIEKVSSSKLRAGDVVTCAAGEVIPGDGEVIEGIATVDESVITGESAPVIRESGGDRSAVTGGTRVLSDHIKIKITSNPGETFLDRMIALVEGAERQKTPNEIALNIMIAALTIIFLFAVATLVPFAVYSVNSAGAGTAPTIAVYTALLVCLIPTTIGGLLSAIGIAGMDRVMQHNVLAMSGKAVEAAGDVNTLLLDKTGTITLGSRQAVAFLPAAGVTEGELADAAQLSSLADETPEGRSIVVLAKEKYGLRGRDVAAHHAQVHSRSPPTRR